MLVFGTNCVGKSSVGRALAGRIDRCAFIEIDELRYMIVGGLVAYSGGAKPWEHPDEYRQQCSLGLANAVRLAHGFAKAGFSSVIDGLDEECLPETGWARTQFSDLQIRNVALVCEPALSQRWKERGWPDDAFRERRLEELAWVRANRALFDCVFDTTRTEPVEAAASIAAQLFAGGPA